MIEKQHNTSATKRKNYLSWDETFMLMAYLMAQRSKDPNTQTGACIVDEENVIVGLGYNGFPRGCSDDLLPWTREGDFLNKKYAYVVHSEVNAIYNSNRPVKNCRLYSSMFPCNECTKTIIQSGIKEIVYSNDPYHDDEQWIASRKMLELAGIKYRQYIPQYDLKDFFSQKKENEEQTTQTREQGVDKEKEDDQETSQFIFENIPIN